MNALTSGCGGKNYGTEIRTVEKQKTQGKNGANVYLNLVQWLVMKSRQTLGIKTCSRNIYCSCINLDEVYLRVLGYTFSCCSSMGSRCSDGIKWKLDF